MPKKEVINSAELTPGRAPLSQATRFGNLVFVQGCTGRHPTTGAVGRDIREQTRFALDRIKLILEAAGTSLENVLANTWPGSTRCTPSISPATCLRAPPLS